MSTRRIAVVMLCGACGKVASTPASDAPSDTASSAAYHGAIAKTDPPVSFGDPLTCGYTMVFRQIEIDLQILPSGSVSSGSVQALYDEDLVTPNTCNTPVADPSVTHYTFASANGTQLTFTERTGDKPGTSLVAQLSGTPPSYQLQLTFKRIDLGAPLTWMVTTTTSLARTP